MVDPLFMALLAAALGQAAAQTMTPFMTPFAKADANNTHGASLAWVSDLQLKLRP